VLYQLSYLADGRLGDGHDATGSPLALAALALPID
jgi:hypothetical protein